MHGSRATRAGTTGTGRLTKTEQLRQAKSAALVREIELKEERQRQQQERTVTRRRIVAEPKKVDFSKPTMTKAMMARMQHAEKFKQDYERKREEIQAASRRPVRTRAPIGGDARMGRERSVGRTRRGMATSGLRTPSPRRMDTESRIPRSFGRSDTPRGQRRIPEVRGIPEKTNELARSMNADLVQAEPVGEGPIDSIVIPPGMVSDDRTTVISIQQPAVVADVEAQTSQIANRSIQVISETLDNQDAVEAASVQNRLAELQQARREFVIAVANVGGNAVNIGEEMAQPTAVPIPRAIPQPTPQRRIYRVPDVEDSPLRVRYGRDHPDVVAAREFMARRKEREAAQRMEEEFQRLAREAELEELQLNVPMEEELIHEGDISWEEDPETGIVLPIQSRVKASMPAIPRRQEVYDYEPFDPEELERFMDVQGHPPCPVCGPPPGREDLHPDLWELDDPWYQAPPEPDMPDLIQFD